MFVRRFLPVLAVVAALGLVWPSTASAATGPEGFPITQGHVVKDLTGAGGVKTPLNLPYAWLDKSAGWGKGPMWTFGGVDLVLQPDGNLVMYPKGDYANKNYSRHMWASNTAGSGATQLLFQWDGNLVLYTSGYAKHVWASNSQNKCTGNENPALSAQSDSNLVIYCGYPAIVTNIDGPWIIRYVWATHTS